MTNNIIPNNGNDNDFYLDPSLIDTNIVNRIAIENSINSFIVEVLGQTITQTICPDDFTTKTIQPLKKQIEGVITNIYNEDERKKIISSIVTCINKNIDKITEHVKHHPKHKDSDEKGIVDNLVTLALNPENAEKIFNDQYGKPYALVNVGNDKNEIIMPISNLKFKRYLSRLCRQNLGSCISDSSLSTVITNIAAEAESKNEIIPLHLRIAWGSKANRSKEDCIYYDTCDSRGRIIEISKDCWKIIEGSDEQIPILFRRYNQLPLVEPDRNHSSDIFNQLLNLTNIKNIKHRHLIKVYIISTLIPEIDHVILTTYGPKGAAKSFLLELIKKLVDPSKPMLLTLHRNVDQFIQQVNHNHLNYYDNVKYIPYWLSDEICKAVTGIGHTKRQLFTDDEDIVYEHRRCLALNGINVALTESDALDKSVFIELEEIEEEKRRKEEDLWREFERIKPQVLGFILDTLSKAMKIKTGLRLNKLPRMADFSEWGEAISQAMGYPPMTFLEVYGENRNELNIIAINENPVGALVLKYIQEIENQYGPLTKLEFELQELYKKLVDFAASNDISIVDRNFPKNASSLVKKLKTVIPNLKAVYGIVIEVGRNTTTNTSVITVSKKKLTTTISNEDPSSGGSEPPETKSTTLHFTDNAENSSSTVNTDVNTADSTSDLNQNK